MLMRQRPAHPVGSFGSGPVLQIGTSSVIRATQTSPETQSSQYLVVFCRYNDVVVGVVVVVGEVLFSVVFVSGSGITVVSGDQITVFIVVVDVVVVLAVVDSKCTLVLEFIVSFVSSK